MKLTRMLGLLLIAVHANGDMRGASLDAKAGSVLQAANADQSQSDTVWSHQPVVMPKNAAQGIDGFIREKLAAAGLKAAGPAAERVLRRWLSFDLVGLPPDESNESYKAYMTHLPDLPRYGERWGRQTPVILPKSS
jgi:hypothetical protein